MKNDVIKCTKVKETAQATLAAKGKQGKRNSEIELESDDCYGKNGS